MTKNTAMKHRTAPLLSGLASVGVVLAFVATPRDASAAPGGSAQWVVDIAGDDCDVDRAELEREIRLACEAVGGTCNIVESPRDAELRAKVTCASGEEPWTLEMRTVEGHLLSRVELAGAKADRLREAAVEVARDAAPERVLAVESLSNTLDGDRGPSVKRQRLSVAASARGSAGGNGEAAGLGGRGMFGMRIGPDSHATLAFEGVAGGTTERESMRHLRTGLGVVFGAPFTTFDPKKSDTASHLVGLGLEGGADFGSYYSTFTRTGSTSPRPTTTVAAYAQTTIYFAIPTESLQPYAALSASVLTAQPYVAASADLGLSLPLF